MIENLPLSLYLFVILWSSSLSLTLRSFSIRDLEGNSSSFATETAQWKEWSSGASQTYVNCGATPLLQPSRNPNEVCGQNVYRDYNNLPPHTTLFITFKFWIIDDTSSYQIIYVWLPGLNFFLKTEAQTSRWTGNFCGDSEQDLLPIIMLVQLPHNASSLHLNIWGSDTSSFGFRDITILISNQTSIHSSVCGITHPKGLLYRLNCECHVGSYYDTSTLQCEYCDPSCYNCFGPTSSQCYSCSNKYTYNGLQCVLCNSVTPSECIICSPGEYLHSDSLCKGFCDSPSYSQSIWNGVSYCDFKCLPDSYYYKNGSCIPECNYPFYVEFQGINRFCQFPCPPGQLFHVDGTCKTTCPTPYIQKLQGVESYCWFPCSLSQYLYSNGSCLPNCNYAFNLISSIRWYGTERSCQFQCSPGLFLYSGLFYSGSFWYSGMSCISGCLPPYIQRSFGIESYCSFPCLATAYFYQNNTCFSDCLPHFNSSYDGLNKFCRFQCASGLFLYPNSSCLSTCLFPYIQKLQGVEAYCLHPCNQTADYFYANSSCMEKCPFPFKSRTDGYIKFCDFPCEPGTFLHSNNTCSSSCSAVYVKQITQGVEYYCNFTCTLSEYFYSNNSCLSTCPFPFKSRTDGYIKLCDFPCEPGAFLHSNNTCCNSTCPSPYVPKTQGVEAYCNFPCNLTNYLYSNNSCRSTCLSPFYNTTDGLNNLCHFPCGPSEYLYSNDTCSSTCSFPNIQKKKGVESYCSFICKQTEYLYENYTCLPGCNSPFSNTTTITGQFCNFFCAPGFYLYSNNSCYNSCPMPYIQKNQGVEKYCSFLCNQTEYFYSNYTCRQKCEYPFKMRMDGLNRLCDFPCPSGSYYSSDGSCQIYCSNPFIKKLQGVESYCQSPCNQSEYLYENNTCASKCDSPSFYVKVKDSENYCIWKCGLGNYLYANDFCYRNCSPPYLKRIQGIELYCDFPCSKEEYLYPNNSCLPNCDYPFYSSDFDDTNKLCKFPCKAGKYLHPNGSCLTSCNPPMTIQTDMMPDYWICKSSCGGDRNLFYYQKRKICRRTCSSPYTEDETTTYKSCKDDSESITQNMGEVTTMTSTIVITGVQVATAATSSGSSCISIGIIMKMFAYIKYLNVTYSLELEEALKTWKTSIVPIQFAPQLPEDSDEKDHPLPIILSKSEVLPRFLSNFWPDLFFILLVLAVCLTLRIIEWISMITKSRPLRFFHRLRTIVQGFLLTQLYGSYGAIIMYSMLEFRTMSFKSTMSILSFFVSILCLIFLTFNILIHFILLLKYQRIKEISIRNKDPQKLKSFISTLKGFDLLFKDFHDQSLWQHGFLLVFTLRDFLLSFVLTSLFDYPLAQSIIFVSVSVAMMLYLYFKRPYRELLDLAQEIFCETAILVANINVLLSAMLDLLECDNGQVHTTRIIIGRIIIFMNTIFPFVALLYLVLCVGIAAKEAYSNYTRNKDGKRIMKMLGRNEGFRFHRGINHLVPRNQIDRLGNSCQFNSFRARSIALNKKIGEIQLQINTHRATEIERIYQS